MLLTPTDPVAQRVRHERRATRSPAVQTDIIGVMTNKIATDAIRGAGRPEATHLIEVTIDQLADELGMDRLELRRKNFIPPFFTARDRDRRRLRLRQLRGRARQAARAHRRGRGPPRGRGSCASAASTAASASRTYTEICGTAPSRAVGPGGFGLQAGGWESATVRVHASGSVTLYTGTSPHGQGHETGVRPDRGRPSGHQTRRRSRSSTATPNTGPWGSTPTGRARSPSAARPPRGPPGKVQDKARAIVAHQLEADPADIELAGDKYIVAGSPDKGMTLAEVGGRRLRPREPAGGHGARARRDVVLRPGELRVPVRRARVRGRRRRGDRQRRRSSATSRSTTAGPRSTRC